MSGPNYQEKTVIPPEEIPLNQAAFHPPVPAAPVMSPAAVRTVEDGEIEINLVEIAYMFWQNIWMIILCFIIGATIAFAYTRFYVTPMYTATARMYILSSSTNSVVNLSDLQISSSLRSDYQELLTSRPILEKVISSLNLEYDYASLRGMVTVTNPNDTRILNVTVVTPSPQLSADIANQLVKQGQLDLPAIMKSEEPSIFEDAIVPTGKSSPSFLKNTAIGGIIAAFLYCAFLVFRQVTNDTVITPDDMYNAFGIKPLATIPDSKLDDSGKRSGRKKNRHKIQDSDQNPDYEQTKASREKRKNG